MQEKPRGPKKARKFGPKDEAGWNNRWNVADSKGNGIYHPFYKEYFGKTTKQTDGNFVFSYAQTSGDKLPGIIDVRDKARYADVSALATVPGQDALELHCVTRYPVGHV